jgi:hypothetical protein
MWDTLFADGAAWFSVPAIAGTAVFLLKITFMMIGVDDADIGSDPIDVHHGDATDAFKILSIQSIAAFCMGFGWGGVAALHGLHWSWPTSVAAGIGCGLILMYVLALGLKGMHDMQSSGNVTLDMVNGAQGRVYISVPEDGRGRGQVRLVVGTTEKIVQAVSADGPLPTGTAVRVTAVNEDNTVTVVRA